MRIFRKKTGCRDKNGRRIRVGDRFRWFLPAGFRTCYDDPFPLASLVFGWEPGTIHQDHIEVSIVREVNGEFILEGTGENKGYISRLDGQFPDGSYRYQHGEVI